MRNEDTPQNEESMLVSTFVLGDAAFGVYTAKVQEVVRVGSITPVRGAAPCVLGIMNLRGRIATIIDLGLKLGIGAVDEARTNRIFIIDSRSEPIGLLVDSVTEVIEVDRADLEPVPENLAGIQGRQLMGVTQVGGRVTALLNLDAVLAVEHDNRLMQDEER